jgi:hypothetical protein
MIRAVLGEAELEREWVERYIVRHEVMEGSRRMAAFGRQMATEVMLARSDAELALHHLAAAAALPLIDLAWMDRCPLFAGVRDEPRFAAARALVAARVDDMWS